MEIFSLIIAVFFGLGSLILRILFGRFKKYGAFIDDEVDSSRIVEIPKFNYPVSRVIKNIAKDFSFNLSKDEQRNVLTTAGTVQGFDCRVDYLENSECIQFFISLPETGFKPFWVSNRGNVNKNKVFTGDVRFDNELFIAGADDIFVIFLNPELRQRVLDIAPANWSFVMENSGITLRIDTEHIRERKANNWDPVLEKLVTIAPFLQKVPENIEQEIASRYEKATISTPVRMKCLQWLVQKSRSIKKRNHYLLKGLASNDIDTINFCLKIIENDPGMQTDDLLSEVSGLVLYPQEFIWGRVIHLAKDKALAVVLKELEKIRKGNFLTLKDYRHCFEVLHEVNRKEYWKQLEADTFKDRLPNDVRGFLFSEIKNREKWKYLPRLRKYLLPEYSTAIVPVIDMIEEKGTLQDVSSLARLGKSTSSAIVREAVKQALEVLKFQYGDECNGWLSVSEQPDTSGALSMTEKTDGALSVTDEVPE